MAPTFSHVTTISGSYSLTLTWDQIETVEDVTTPPGGVMRTLVAQFFDQAGHSTSQSLVLQIACPSSGDAICSGESPLRHLRSCLHPGRQPLDLLRERQLYQLSRNAEVTTSGKRSRAGGSGGAPQHA